MHGWCGRRDLVTWQGRSPLQDRPVDAPSQVDKDSFRYGSDTENLLSLAQQPTYWQPLNDIWDQSTDDLPGGRLIVTSKVERNASKKGYSISKSKMFTWLITMVDNLWLSWSIAWRNAPDIAKCRLSKTPPDPDKNKSNTDWLLEDSTNQTKARGSVPITWPLPI